MDTCRDIYFNYFLTPEISFSAAFLTWIFYYASCPIARIAGYRGNYTSDKSITPDSYMTAAMADTASDYPAFTFTPLAVALIAYGINRISQLFFYSKSRFLELNISFCCNI